MPLRRCYYIIIAMLYCSYSSFAADTTQIKALYDSGINLMDRGQLDSTELYFQQGQDMARKINDRFFVALGFYHLSRVAEQKHDLSEAILKLDEALSIFESLGRKRNIGNCYNSYNRIYQTLGNYTKALDYGLRALRVKEENKDNLAITLTNIGNIYLRTDRYDEAIAMFTRAMAADSAANDREGVGISLLNLGVAYQKKGDYEKALMNHRASLEIFREMGSRREEAFSLNNIGSTLRRLGKPDSSLVYLLAGLELKQELKIGISHIMNDITDTYLTLKQSENALKNAQLAIQTAEKESNLSQLQYAWKNLGKCHELTGDFKRAYDAFQQHVHYKDSLTGIEKEKQLSELQVQYDTEKKEQSIALLTRQKEAADFRRNTYLIVGTLVAVILLLLFNWQRITSRKNRQLYEKGLEIEKMKSSFFSNISHEFRTPLTLILGPAQTMRAATDDPKMISQLTTMEKNAQRLLTLVDQLLDLSKLESGKLAASLSTLDIVPIVRGVTMTFSSMAAARQIDLQMQIETGSLELNADKEKVETVLINLLSNAFKFTPEKGVIKVSLDNIEKNNSAYCRISVRDSGIGIAEKDLPHVFDRFYQGDEGQRTQYGGSGIGLALAKELVQLHKGHIEVTSKLNEGTTVAFYLPVEAGYTSKPEATEPEQNGPVLLLIEDNEDVLVYLKDILQSKYTILEAKDGEAGIALAIETIPDLVISDVMMPKKDGYAVCETLKQDEKTSHIPLISINRAGFIRRQIAGPATKGG